MLTEVMQHYGLARPPIDAGFFETEHPAQVSHDIQAAITRGRLIAADPFDRVIDLRITRLRRKVEIDPAHPDAIRTVRGIGYMFVPPKD
jgi:hypothetical protein